MYVIYNNKEYKTQYKDIKNGRLGFINKMLRREHDYEVGNIINNLEIMELIDVFNSDGKFLKSYKYKCMVCGYSAIKSQDEFRSGGGCAACVGNAVHIGFNDMWTTNPEMAKMLANPNDGYSNTQNSHTKLDWVCQECNNVICDIPPNSVYRQGLSCKSCGDGVSYPNKLMFNLLTQININFENEVKFEWCNFKDLYGKDTYGFYDFVIEDIKLIIEMDGGFHNKTNNMTKKSSKYTKHLDITKDMLAKNNGYETIRINCDYKNINERMDHIKSHILSSDLVNIFNLTLVDWNEIDKKSQKSLIVKASDIWNSGVHSTSQIAKMIGVSSTCIYTYLKLGRDIGLNNYSKELSRKEAAKIRGRNRVKPIICIDNGFVFNNYSICESNTNLFNVDIKGKSLVAYIRQNKKYKNYDFKYITQQEFNNIKSQSPELAFGDYFILPEETAQQ